MDKSITKKSKSTALHRCRFPDWSPSSITALSLTPTSFNTNLLNFGQESKDRGILAVGRANGDVELMCWGGHQGWTAWRTLPSSFPLPLQRNSKKPSSLLSHLVFTHQTTLSDSDLALYDGDLPGATLEIERLEREGVRLFGVGGVGSELVEWEWGGPGAKKEVGRVKSTLPTLPPIFALAASRSSSFLAVGCEDSTIRILNIMDDDLALISKIEVGGPGKVRALSLAWGPPIATAVSTEVVSKGKAREDSPDPASLLPLSFSTPSESYLLAGCSNSSIRKYALSSPSSNIWISIQRMSLDALKGEQTVVWSLAVLGDGTFVSGDSMGIVKFWDGKMGTQIKSFKAHRADVLCLTPGADGTSLFTSGVDQKTTEFRLVSVTRSSSNSIIENNAAPRWIQASGRRLHCHDVRAMVVSPAYTLPLPDGFTPPPTASTLNSTSTKVTPVLTSGGLDLNLITVCCTSASSSSPTSSSSSSSSKHLTLSNPISESTSTEFESTTHRRASYVPQRSKPFLTAGGKDSRYLILRRERSIGIWKLDDPKLGSGFGGYGSNGRERERDVGWGKKAINFEALTAGEEEEREEVGGGWNKVLDMNLKLQTNLISSAASEDGKWLAVSDLFETKLFKLSYKNEELHPKRQKSFSSFLSSHLPPSLGTGSSCLLFTSDSTRLILTTSFGATIAIVELPQGRSSSGSGGVEGEEFKILKVFGQHGTRGNGENGREIRGSKRSKGLNGGGDSKMNGHGSDSEDNEEEEEEEEDVEMSSSNGKFEFSNQGQQDKPATVVTLGVSADGKWLASADLERKVCVFDLESLKHHTTLPTPTSVPTSLTFLPITTSSPSPILLLGLPTNSISLYNLDSSKFESWSLPLQSLLTNTLMDIREPLIGVIFEPRDSSSSSTSSTSNSSVSSPLTNGHTTAIIHESRKSLVNSSSTGNESLVAVVWGANWVARIDLDQLKLGEISTIGGKGGNGIKLVRREADKKRARDEELGFIPSLNVTNVTNSTAATKLEIKVTRRYQPLVLLDFVGNGELVAVEKTWFDLAKGLPEAWVRSGEFGT